MTTTSRLRATEVALGRIAPSSDDLASARREVLGVLRRAVPFDVGVFSTVDPATLLWTGCVLHGADRDPRREAFAFDNEYRHDDLHKVAELVSGPRRAARMSAVRDPVREASPRYRAMLDEGVADELRCALVDRDSCWGSLELFRAHDAGPFSDEDVETATALSASLARWLRLDLLRVAASRPGSVDDPPAVLVLDEDGAVEAASHACERLLRQLDPGEGLPPSIVALRMRLDGENAESTSMRVPRASGGWVAIHATRLRASDGCKVNIVLEPVKAPILAPTLARAYGFTHRECEVVELLALGLGDKQIGGRLAISPYTVADHTKAAYAKAGVRSRQQLVAALFFDHCLPRRERGTPPGPYGWFLDDVPGEAPIQ